MLKQISKLVLLFSVLGLLQNCSTPADEVLEPTVVSNTETTTGSNVTGRMPTPGNSHYLEIFIIFSPTATFTQKLELQNYFVNSIGEEVISGNLSSSVSAKGGSSSIVIWKLNTDEPLPPISNCEECNVDDIELPEDLLTLITAYTL